MATTTTRQIIAEDPAIEAYRKGLLESVNKFVRDRISKGLVPPDFQVQQLSAPERQAIDLARSGVGAYQPFLQGATADLARGQQFLGQAGLAAQGGFGQYDPRAGSGVAAFMNPTNNWLLTAPCLTFNGPAILHVREKTHKRWVPGRLAVAVKLFFKPKEDVIF